MARYSEIVGVYETPKGLRVILYVYSVFEGNHVKITDFNGNVMDRAGLPGYWADHVYLGDDQFIKREGVLPRSTFLCGIAKDKFQVDLEKIVPHGPVILVFYNERSLYEDYYLYHQGNVVEVSIGEGNFQERLLLDIWIDLTEKQSNEIIREFVRDPITGNRRLIVYPRTLGSNARPCPITIAIHDEGFWKPNKVVFYVNSPKYLRIKRVWIRNNLLYVAVVSSLEHVSKLYCANLNLRQPSFEGIGDNANYSINVGEKTFPFSIDVYLCSRGFLYIKETLTSSWLLLNNPVVFKDGSKVPGWIDQEFLRLVCFRNVIAKEWGVYLPGEILEIIYKYY